MDWGTVQQRGCHIFKACLVPELSAVSSYLNHKKFESLMSIIDVHVHIYPPERQYKLLRWIKKSFPEHPVDDKVTPEGIMKDLEEQGITQFINLVYPLMPEETEPLNEFNAAFCRNHKNADGFASIHPKNINKEKIIKKAFYELGLLGLKFHPFIQRIDLRDPAMKEIWTICEKLERPIFLHTGYESFYKRKLSPLCVMDILVRHPGLYLVINHACFPDLISAFEMARRFKGVYIDLTNVPGSIPYFQADFNGYDLIEILLNGIHEFSGRVFFGTDHPVGMGGADEILKQFEDLNLSVEEYQTLTYNAPLNFINKFKL
jgi:hypothetical protein